MSDYSEYQHLRISVDELGVATVAIPVVGSVGRRQAEIHREISTVWTRLGEDRAVRSILVTGEGDEFYVSADIHGVKAIPGMSKEDTFDLLQRMAKEGVDIVYKMVELDKPIVAAINGKAAGGGLAVALLADISIAADDAELVDPHVAMGLAAGDHAAMIWPLLCGMAKAKLYLLTSDPVSGAEAERIGLVSLARPAAEVVPTARRYAERLAEGAPFAIRYTKKALNQWLRLGGVAAMDYSNALELLNFFGSELRDAVAAATTEGQGGAGPA